MEVNEKQDDTTSKGEPAMTTTTKSRATSTLNGKPTVYFCNLILTTAPYASLLPGGKEETTFWQDFSIADRWGKNAIKDTFDRAFKEWKHDIRYLTELSMALNHKIWAWYEKDEEIARVYNDMWEKVNDYVYESGKVSQKDIDYYFSVTD